MPRTAQRPDRINLRLSRNAKRRLERAAAYSDKTLTDFVIDVALQKAGADGTYLFNFFTSREEGAQAYEPPFAVLRDLEPAVAKP